MLRGPRLDPDWPFSGFWTLAGPCFPRWVIYVLLAHARGRPGLENPVQNMLLRQDLETPYREINGAVPTTVM